MIPSLLIFLTFLSQAVLLKQYLKPPPPVPVKELSRPYVTVHAQSYRDRHRPGRTCTLSGSDKADSAAQGDAEGEYVRSFLIFSATRNSSLSTVGAKLLPMTRTAYWNCWATSAGR